MLLSFVLIIWFVVEPYSSYSHKTVSSITTAFFIKVEAQLQLMNSSHTQHHKVHKTPSLTLPNHLPFNSLTFSFQSLILPPHTSHCVFSIASHSPPSRLSPSSQLFPISSHSSLSMPSLIPHFPLTHLTVASHSPHIHLAVASHSRLNHLQLSPRSFSTLISFAYSAIPLY